MIFLQPIDILDMNLVTAVFSFIHLTLQVSELSRKQLTPFAPYRNFVTTMALGKKSSFRLWLRNLIKPVLIANPPSTFVTSVNGI